MEHGFSERENRNNPQLNEEIVKCWSGYAEQGNAFAQTHIGDIYREGELVKQDNTAAVGWYRKAVKRGDGKAAIGLGNLYEEGLGVKQDYAEAMKWYEQAKSNDQRKNPVFGACFVGKLYALGRGVKQDDVEAMKWFQKAENEAYSGWPKKSTEKIPEDIQKTKSFLFCKDVIEKAMPDDVIHDPAYKPITRFDELKLQRGGCYGSCPIYTMTIKGDGYLSFQGDGYVRKIGLSKTTLSQEQIAQLVNAINKMDFLTMSSLNFSGACMTEFFLCHNDIVHRM